MSSLLGDFSYVQSSFPETEEILESFAQAEFIRLPVRKRFRGVNRSLLNCIQSAPKQSFLLPAVLDYISRVDTAGVLDEPYQYRHFEFWLDKFSKLDKAENAGVRARIAGKNVPRDAYQVFFPIGTGKTYSGGHFVAAHASPDVDTAIASFWGWMDAFAARVSAGQHHWSLPSTHPGSHIQRIFDQLFGRAVFTHLAHTSATLTLSARDLMTIENVHKEIGSSPSTLIEHSPSEAVVLVDDEGCFVGDWRRDDVEPVRQMLMAFKACLRWFENNLHHHLISLFAQDSLGTSDIPAFIQAVFGAVIRECEPAQEFNARQAKDLHDFFRIILGVKHGLSGTFDDLVAALGALSLSAIRKFRSFLEALGGCGLFDDQGKLIEDRSAIFNVLETVIKDLDRAIIDIHNYVDRLDVVMRIKHDVLGRKRHYVTTHSDVEELRIRIKHYDYLTVVIPLQDGKLYPLGVVTAHSLRKKVLGTVSQRDFCNREESKMASYLEVISVVDHHKTTLSTGTAPLAIIGDAQSSNVLVAEQTFRINDSFSLNGMTIESIDAQIQALATESSTSRAMRLQQRLLQKRIITQGCNGHYVHPMREYAEYISFLYAILDDTDLLTKVTKRDVVCVASLLNRLKSLMLGQEAEIIDFDDLPHDDSFSQLAAKRILQNVDMYSIYKKIYVFREQEVEENLELCSKGEDSNIFDDTKEQNGCNRVGQTKIFASNYFTFAKHCELIREDWLGRSLEINGARPEIDFHMHMVSTISSADDVFQGSTHTHSHDDELWIWVAPTQSGYERLASFLSAFQELPALKENALSLELPGPNAEKLEQVFVRNFPKTNVRTPDHKKPLPIAILRFDAGSINSRKSMITPYLPHLVM